MAADAGDFAEARRLAHSLKGMAKLVGAPALCAAAGAAEDSFAHGEANSALMAEVEAALAEVMKELEQANG